MRSIAIHRPKSHSFSIRSGLVASIVLCAGLPTCSQAWFVYETESLNQRIDETILLVGCIIIEPEKYMHQPLNIQFAYQQTGKNKIKSVLGKTDSLGYFILPNMPLGRYAISDVWQKEPPDDILLGVDDRYEDNQWQYLSSYFDFPLPSHPHQWPEIHEGGIINLEYLILTFDDDIASRGPGPPSNWIKAYKRSLLTGDRFLSDCEYFRPSIPAYLLEKYPNSARSPCLRRLINEPQ